MLDRLTAADWRPYLDQTFHVGLEGHPPLPIRLVSLTELGSAEDAEKLPARRRGFSIVWKGPLDPILPQHVYRIDHPQMGVLEIFVVPIGPHSGEMQYEAIFN